MVKWFTNYLAIQPSNHDILTFMILGMKVGPQERSFTDLDAANPPFVEVWFNINRAAEYERLFDLLKKRGIQTGLHFWGALPDGTWTNLAYPDNALIQTSRDLIRKTIDIAAQNKFVYVNIHPGAAAKVQIDFSKEEFRLLSEPVDTKIAQELFFENASELETYAASQGVVFTVETVPARVTKTWYGETSRLTPFNIHELPNTTVIEYAKRGHWVANDFCHLASSVISDNPEEIRAFENDATRQMAPKTRLLHLGFIVPPYNGTDFHSTLDNPLFDTDKAIPNKSHLRELLSLFKNRDDVWALVEPEIDHPKNFLLAKQLIEQL